MKRSRLITLAAVTITGAATLVSGCQSGSGAAASHTPTAGNGTATTTGTAGTDKVAPADDATQSASAKSVQPKRPGHRRNTPRRLARPSWRG